MNLFAKGNDAVVIGALYAGCDAYFGYPITPASEIAHSAADWFPKMGRVFLQAECETNSIYMVYGAAAAGKLSMTASSGPGLSLMQEGVSYLAGSQLPAVIVNVMRTGPGLGNIGPEQGDYNQSVKGGGHGNYHNIVLAPGSVQEMCDFTIRAFSLSLKYRNPAVVLTDGVLGQMMEPLQLPTDELPQPETASWALHGDKKTQPNLVTSIILQPEQQEEFNFMLQEKYESMNCEASAESWLTEDADLIITGYGIVGRIARTVVEELRAQGIKAGLFRPQTLFPFPERKLQEIISNRPNSQLLVAELSNGQYRDDVILHLGDQRPQIHFINRMGGMLLEVDAIAKKAKEILKDRS
jgi:2-oxoisovalerate ferredoxin oxidoreductase alpha subunit